ncbi:TIGR04222 domain-containing membrane protein [Streptomyces pilosus]|uniref:TIGR04222 domain-containing membrane protein n=1 Tax=Streptomyces pilosus TaxID=28893 RepID=UPI00199DBDBC|nr:TIGR04222 domain-containing membrane protein [Streptomyces pilosus]GGV43081.1 hypothetical protein GCM10010261_16160 [Streptomyces pilosus]
MADTGRVRGTPHEIALLAGGPRAAVTVAVVALHLRGAVEAGAPGTVRAVDGEAGRALPPLPAPGSEPGALTGAMRAAYLESAVYHRLAEPSAIRELVRDLDIRWAVAELRVGLAEAGMLRYPLLGSTRAARRRLQVLRKAVPAAGEQARPAGRRAAARRRPARRDRAAGPRAPLRPPGGTDRAGEPPPPAPAPPLAPR